jgi:hypothetical protein
MGNVASKSKVQNSGVLQQSRTVDYKGIFLVQISGVLG